MCSTFATYDSERPDFGGADVAVSRVVVYFEKAEDALQFTMAASSVISADEAGHGEALVKVGREICKASRIRTEDNLNLSEMPADPQKLEGRCA